MSIKSKVTKALSEFAIHIMDEAKKSDTKLTDKTEAFKAVTAYYGHLAKAKTKPDDDEPAVPTFEGYRRRVNGDEEQDGRAAKNPRVQTDN